MTKRLMSGAEALAAFRCNKVCGAALACTLLLQGCSDEAIMADTEVTTFQNVEQCVQSGKHSQEDCESADRTARAAYVETAPHFDTLEQCQAESSNCEPAWERIKPKEESSSDASQDADLKRTEEGRHGGSSVFIYHGGSTYYSNGYAPSYGGFAVTQGQVSRAMPVYQTNSSGLRTPSGVTGLNYGQPAMVPRSSVTTSVPTVSGRASPSAPSSYNATPSMSGRSAPSAPSSYSAAPVSRGGFGGGAVGHGSSSGGGG